MSRYALLAHGLRDGVPVQVVENIIVANEWPNGILLDNIEAPVAIGWFYIDDQFIEPIAIEEVADLRITPMAFLNRFSDEESTHLKIVAAINPVAPVEEQRLSGLVGSFYDKVLAAKYIALNDPRLIDGMASLEFLGILEVGRAAAILNAPVLDIERP